VTPQPASGHPAAIREIERYIRVVPNFPQPGISFKDITPLIEDGGALHAAVDALAGTVEHLDYDRIVSAEARGFVFGTALAYRARKGLVLARKPGKLPGRTRETSYDLEYGSNVLQVHLDALLPGERVLVVDDVLATGGTAAAAGRLVLEAGAVLVGFSVLLELAALGGRDVLTQAHPTTPLSTLLTY